MIVRPSVRTSLLIAAAILLTAAAPPQSIHYPESRRVDHVDTYHETAVPDPYRWLETDVRESTEVAAWVEASNSLPSSTKHHKGMRVPAGKIHSHCSSSRNSLLQKKLLCCVLSL